MIFSTADVPPDEAFDCWMDVVQTNISKFKIENFDRRNFFADLRVGTLGDLAIQEWHASPGISRCDGADELLLVLPSPRRIFEFKDRVTELNRNTICLFDCREPFVGSAPAALDRIQVRLPRDLLKRRASLLDTVNRSIPLTPDTRFLTTFVRNLVRAGPSTLSPDLAAMVSEQLLDLIAAALPVPSPAPVTLDYARRIMEAGILDAGRIADRPARARAALAAAGRKTRD